MRLAPAVFALALSISALAFDPASLSKDVKPRANFDAFVHGPWTAANDALLERALRELSDKAAQQTSPGLKLLARYCASGMDEAAIEARGLRSLDRRRIRRYARSLARVVRPRQAHRPSHQLNDLAVSDD